MRRKFVSIVCLLGFCLASAQAATVTLSTPESLTLSPGDTNVAAPIRISDVTGLGVVSAHVVLSYDATLIEPTGFKLDGTVAEGSLAVSQFTPGQAQLTLANADALTGEGVLAFLMFDVIAAGSAELQIRLVSARLNEGPDISVNLEPKAIRSFTLSLDEGLNFLHVPMMDPDIRTVADLYRALGEDISVIIYYDAVRQGFRSYSEPFNQPDDPVNIALAPHTGLIAVMKPGTQTQVVFEGTPYSEVEIPLRGGLNLIGLPIHDTRLRTFGDLAALDDRIQAIVGQNAMGDLKAYPGVDLPIMGGRSLIVVAGEDTRLQLSGEP